MSNDHGIGIVEYPVTQGSDTARHRVVCKCRIAFTGDDYGQALGLWGDHVKRCREGIECPRP